MKKIIKVTDQLSDISWYYTSITACLEDVENPVAIGNRRWSQIIKEKGYPFDHSGCTIDLVYARSVADIREKNPPEIQILIPTKKPA